MPDDNANDKKSDSGAVISDHTTSPIPDESQSKQDTTSPSPPQDTTNVSTTGDSAPDINDQKPSGVVTDPESDGGNKKIIATIFGVLFLIGGIVAGVFLVQRQQNLEEEASSGSACQQADDCVLFDEPGNQGSETVTQTIRYLDITNKPGEERRYFPGEGGDDCYNVSIDGRNFSWQRIGDGPTCRDVSNIQVWLQDEQSTLSASCQAIQAFDENWNQLSTGQLEELEAGATIKFAVEGTTDNGTIDKARFRVNSSQWQETTDLKPGEASTFYINYTIPEGSTDFTVNAQVHLSENDNWY